LAFIQAELWKPLEKAPGALLPINLFGSFMTTTPEALKPLLWEPKNLVRAIESAGVALWSWNVDTDALAMDDHAYDLWGVEGLRNETPPQ
jgi:hypothetical protein